MRNDPSIEIEKAFEYALLKIKESVPFDSAWRSENGYFENAMDFPLEPGKVVKSVCEHTERRMIMVGTCLGTVVVFERHAPKMGQKFVLVHNSHKQLALLLGTSALSLAQFSLVLTSWDIQENIGSYLESLFGAMMKTKTKRVDVATSATHHMPISSMQNPIPRGGLI